MPFSLIRPSVSNRIDVSVINFLSSVFKHFSVLSVVTLWPQTLCIWCLRLELIKMDANTFTADSDPPKKNRTLSRSHCLAQGKRMPQAFHLAHCDTNGWVNIWVGNKWKGNILFIGSIVSECDCERKGCATPNRSVNCMEVISSVVQLMAERKYFIIFSSTNLPSKQTQNGHNRAMCECRSPARSLSLHTKI